MATISLNSNQFCKPLFQDDPGTDIKPRITGASTTLTSGLIVYDDPTTGTMLIADAATSTTTAQAYGVVISDQSKGAYQSVSVLRRGVCGGWNLTGVNVGSIVYLDTAGTINSVANGTKTVPVGKVVGTSIIDSSGNVQYAIDFFFNPLVNY